MVDVTVDGSPAHAGIDLPLGVPFPRSRRFPRPRGDRPGILLGTVTSGWVSPPTRG